MILLRIDDYCSRNHTKILGIIKESLRIIPNMQILLGSIVAHSRTEGVQLILDEFGESVEIGFHGYSHSGDEFLQDKDIQEFSFIRAEKYFQDLSYKKRIFIPPLNLYNEETISLLKHYKYTDFSINYKDFQSGRLLLEPHFHILETNLFFNKKRVDGSWYITSNENMKGEIHNLISNNIYIGVEIHPQYINSDQDFLQYIFLLNSLKDVL